MNETETYFFQSPFILRREHLYLCVGVCVALRRRRSKVFNHRVPAAGLAASKTGFRARSTSCGLKRKYNAAKLTNHSLLSA